jgi:type III secretory pathway component EscR
MSSTMMHTDNMMNTTNSLVNMEDYQSAQGLAAKSLEVFYNHLKPMMSKNETSLYDNNLEKGLMQLNNSINEKVSPMNLMMIVHTQVHPNFIEAFDIKLL